MALWPKRCRPKAEDISGPRSLVRKKCGPDDPLVFPARLPGHRRLGSFGLMHGLDYLKVYKHGFLIPVVSVQCDFKRSLRYGDRVIVKTKYIPCEAAKLKFTYKLFNAATGELVATGSSVQVFLDKKESVLQLANPPFFEDWKVKHGLM